jgi:hypothetical protein
VRLQSGYLYHYAFAMLIGVLVVATWFQLGLENIVQVWIADVAKLLGGAT